MRLRRARHPHRVFAVLHPIACFVGDRLPGRLLLHPRFHAAALDHEAVDHPMEDRVVVVAIADVLKEIRDGLRRVLGVELERDVAVIRMQDDHGDLYLASTMTAFVMRPSATGTSFGNGPPLPVGAFAILSTTSI